MAATLPLSIVISRGLVEGFKPYAIARLLNAALTEKGLDPVQPQRMYNYDRNGLIVRGSKAQGLYTKDEVDAFIDRYVAKALATPAKAPKTAEQIRAEIDKLQAQLDELLASQDETDNELQDQDIEA